MNDDRNWRLAAILAVITIGYNLAEGLISVIMGISDETLSLFGFGVDSFVEVISGIGIWQMVRRIRKNMDQKESNERTALRITGGAFLALAAGLVITAIYNIIAGNKPSSTFWGIVISSISILTMWFLMKAKLTVGKRLNSDAIIADGHCTRTCLYLSVVLLTASVLYEVFRIGYIDSIGALGIAYYSFMEGLEAIEKSKGKVCKCGCK